MSRPVHSFLHTSRALETCYEERFKQAGIGTKTANVLADLFSACRCFWTVLFLLSVTIYTLCSTIKKVTIFKFYSTHFGRVVLMISF